MAFELSRIDRLIKTYDLAARFPDLDGPFTAATVALLPPRGGPNAATVWYTASVTDGVATVLFAGPDADPTGAVVVSGSADLWLKVGDGSEVDAVKIERIIVLGGGTVTAPPVDRGLPTGGTTGQVLTKASGTAYDAEWDTLSAADFGAQPEGDYATNTALSDGLGAKVNSSTYTAGLAAKQDAATLATTVATNSVIKAAIGRLRALVGAGSPTGGGAQAPQNGPVYTRKIHTMITGGSDIRFQYAQPVAADSDGTLQPVTIHSALEYPLFRRVTDGATTNASATVTSATAAFTSADVGRQIVATGIPITATISSVTNSTTVVMTANSTATGSGLSMDVGGTIYPMTFAGKALGTLENAGTGLLSDAVPVEIPTGAQFASRQFQTSQFGVYTTLTAAASAAATTIQLNTLPGAATNPNGLTGDIVVDTGSNAEKVTVLSYSGSAGAWIAALSPATPLVRAHSNGAIVGGQVAYNCLVYADLGEHGVVGVATDYTTSGIPTAMNPASTTLTAASNIGDRFISTVAPPTGLSITIDTAGNTENATVVNVVGEANPYKVYVSVPLTIAHASGVTMTSGRSAGGFCPVAITAEKITAAPLPAVVIRGDSIASDVGFNVRSNQSFATVMFDGFRPFIKTAKAGESAQQFAVPATARRRKSLDYLAGWLFYEYVTNDIWGARSLAQVQADAATIIGWAKQRGMKVMMCTCLPRTTSTDGWATTGNQTKHATFESVRVAYNTWVRAGAGGLADAVFDGCTVIDSGLVASAAETGLWRAADVNNGPYTASGLHPSYLGHKVLGEYGQTLLPQIV